MDWASGLLGGVMGVGNAVNQIGDEQRKILAEELKMKTLEEIHARQALKQHEYEKERQATDISSREKIHGEGITSAEKMHGEGIISAEKMHTEGVTSAEKIATEGNVSTEKISSERNKSLKDIADERNKLDKWIAEEEHKLKREIKLEDVKSRKAAELRAKISAYTEARHVLENNGSTQEANAVLEAADLPTYEEYVKEPGKEGWLGFGKKEPVIDRRLKKQAPDKTTVDDLVKEGQKTIPPGVGTQSTPGSQLARLVNLHKMAYERGEDPMTNPDIAAATKAYLGKNPGAEKNFVNAINALPESSRGLYNSAKITQKEKVTDSKPSGLIAGATPAPQATSEITTIGQYKGLTIGISGNQYVVQDENGQWRRPTRDENLIINEYQEPKGTIPMGIRQGEDIRSVMTPQRY